jgi:hypothetical protein
VRGRERNAGSPTKYDAAQERGEVVTGRDGPGAGVLNDAKAKGMLDFLSGRISTSVHPAHALGALLVGRLLLSALVADDALVMATVGRFRFGRFPLLFLAFLDQKLITEHLPDELLCLGLGSLVKFAHCGLLPMRTASGCNVSMDVPGNIGFDRLPPRSALEAGSSQMFLIRTSLRPSIGLTRKQVYEARAVETLDAATVSPWALLCA